MYTYVFVYIYYIYIYTHMGNLTMVPVIKWSDPPWYDGEVHILIGIPLMDYYRYIPTI